MGTASRPAKALKPVYTAPNEEAALGALADFSDQWSSKYPEAVATWERAWERFTPFLAYSGRCCAGSSTQPTPSSR
ncbi:transposase [Actinomyces procaprae]|uniref:transposase n=1 Tax=Actinomyces procaprae TaxID=2560010 RepID=UPI003CD0D770